MTPRERAHRGDQRPLFVQVAEIRTERRLVAPLREYEVCHICGEGPGVAVCRDCLEAAIDTRLEEMIDSGRLDHLVQRLLDRRLARASIPAIEPEDHSLVDQVSGDIRD